MGLNVNYLNVLIYSFTSMVHEVVSRGGRCLIPVFAVGPAQELMLILDEYWEAHPELSEIPIYCKYKRWMDSNGG